MIIYTQSLDDITPDKLTGFWVGWPNPPSPHTHLNILQKSYAIWLALEEDTGKVVGFINAISDGVQAAYIPNLEVLPDYQKHGIGSELVRHMLTTLKHLYAIDLMCDPDVQPFYTRLGLMPYTGMIYRNYQRQSSE